MSVPMSENLCSGVQLGNCISVYLFWLQLCDLLLKAGQASGLICWGSSSLFGICMLLLS